MWGLPSLYTAKGTTGNRNPASRGPVKNLQEREAPDSAGFSRGVSLKVSGAPEERAELVM